MTDADDKRSDEGADPSSGDSLPLTDRETTANVREWKLLTGADFEAMDRENTIVLVSCSPLEVHGPHLPVMTDYFEAEGLSYRVMELLTDRRPGIEFVHLPPIYVAADVVPQPGSVRFKSTTIIDVLCDLGRSLAKQGFRHIWVASFHGGPRHFVPIEVAADRVNRRYGTKMVSVFSLLINELTGGESDLSDVLGHIDGVTKEDLKGDAHGGAVETSLMLHLIEEYVRPVYKRLPQMTTHIKAAAVGHPPLEHDGRPSLGSLLKAFKFKLKYYEDESYAGKPSISTPEIGAEILETLAGHTADALEEVLDGRRSLDACHSPLWPARFIFTNQAVSWLFERAMSYKNQVF